MGFGLKSIKKAVKKVGKSIGGGIGGIAGAFSSGNIQRAVAAVGTGGLTEVSRATGVLPGLPDVAESVLAPTSFSDLNVGAQLFADPGSTLATVVTGQSPTLGTAGGTPVGGNLLGGIGGILGTVSGFGGTPGAVAQIGSSFLQGFLPTQRQVGGSGVAVGPTAQQTLAAAPMIKGAAAAVTSFVAPILAKMSASMGKNITLRAAMIIIRRLGKFLQSPTAIAAAVGLSVAELSTLMTASAIAGSSGRRMNVGNVKALRRAHRRIKSFHKLCGDNDMLRKPRTRRAAPKITVCK